MRWLRHCYHWATFTAFLLWMWVLARFHLSDEAVCRMSDGPTDYHDYHDTEHKYPDHFWELQCERCGKKFWL